MSDHLAVSETIHRKQVGRRLRAAISAKGITQADVERTLGASASKLGNWLRGDHYPSAFFVTQFCDRYGITTDWIYRGIVSGMDKTLADALWKSEQPVAERALLGGRPPTKPLRQRKTRPEPAGTDPPPFQEGGRVKENRVSRAVLKVVPPYRRALSWTWSGGERSHRTRRSVLVTGR
jgi:transcriptional regulator with XRE-family HTH domain